LRSQFGQTLISLFLGLLFLLIITPSANAIGVATIVLNNTDSFDFSTNTRGTLAGGDFYYSTVQGGIGKFYANNPGQRGLQDLGNIGNIALNSVTIPTSGYNKYGVEALFYHTYVSLAQTGEEDSYIVFRATGLVTDNSSVTIDALYIPAVALTVSASPASLSTTVGQAVTFTATASGGSSSYSYQWYEGSTAMSGKTSATVTVSKSSTGSFSYYCHVTDSWDELSSNTVLLTVNSPPLSPTPTPTPVVTPNPGGTATPTPIPTQSQPTQNPTTTNPNPTNTQRTNSPTPQTPAPSTTEKSNKSAIYENSSQTFTYIGAGTLVAALIVILVVLKVVKKKKTTPSLAQYPRAE
jgi:plastocyanin